MEEGIIRRVRDALRRLPRGALRATRVAEGRFGPAGWELFPDKDALLKNLKGAFVRRIGGDKGELVYRGVPLLRFGGREVSLGGRRLRVHPNDVLVYVNLGDWGAVIHLSGEEVHVHRAPAVGEPGVRFALVAGKGKHTILLGEGFQVR